MKTNESSLDGLEAMLSRLHPGAVVTMREIVNAIKPQYRDAETLRTAAMLAKKYDITIKGE